MSLNNPQISLYFCLAANNNNNNGSGVFFGNGNNNVGFCRAAFLFA
jgi:hypothetical protein